MAGNMEKSLLLERSRMASGQNLLMGWVDKKREKEMKD